MADHIPTVGMRQARRRLTAAWCVGTGLLVVTLIALTITGKYDDKWQEAWQWFLPTCVPSLTLIIGVVVANAMEITATVARVSRFVYRLALWLSVVYLAFVGISIFAGPFSDAAPIELMQMSNTWLAPFQGLVSAALGVFFVSKDRSE